VQYFSVLVIPVLQLVGSFFVRKLYTEQMFVSMRMQLCNHVQSKPVKRFQQLKAMRYTYDITFGMLQVRENEISPHIGLVWREHWLWVVTSKTKQFGSTRDT